MTTNTNNIIDEWFREFVHATNINQDENIYNKAQASKERLKKLLGSDKQEIIEPVIENATTNKETL